MADIGPNIGLQSLENSQRSSSSGKAEKMGGALGCIMPGMPWDIKGPLAQFEAQGVAGKTIDPFGLGGALWGSKKGDSILSGAIGHGQSYDAGPSDISAPSGGDFSFADMVTSSRGSSARSV